MRRGQGNVEERGTRSVALLQQPHGLVCQEPRRVALFPDRLAVALPVVASAVIVVPVADASGQIAVEVLEAPGLRPVVREGVAEVPFADHHALITGLRQVLRQDLLVEPEPVRVVLPDRHVDAQAHRRLARHQAGTRGTACRLDVEAVELDPICGETIDVRRADLAAVIADVLPAEIIRQDHDDVRRRGRTVFLRGRRRSCEQESGEQASEGRAHHAPSRSTRTPGSSALASAIRSRP